MIRQAHTYLVSAMSGATLIAIAIAAFVLLVSAQVFRDWPVAALGNGDDSSSLSKREPVGPTPAAAAGATAGPGASAATTAGGGGIGKSGGGGSTPTAGAEAPEGGGTDGGEATGGGGPGGSGTGSPASPAPSTADTSAGGGGGSGSTTTSTSGKVAETANGTVTQVDETATGGALNEAGVTPVTEGVVNGVAGTESPVGKVVDETAGAVGGVLPGTR
jgi:hypothetical protein